MDFKKIPVCSPSLCIPRVFYNVTEENIRNTLNTLKFGLIHKIEIVNKKGLKEENFKSVFIHFKKWNENEIVNATREKLLLGEDIKIMYDEPWFWKISAYRKPNNNNSFKYPNTNMNKNINTYTNTNTNTNTNIGFHNNIKTYATVTKPRLLWVPRTPSCSPPRKREAVE